jgi:hypothetical protein
MATGKGVLRGYAAKATVESAHQTIVAADTIGSGSEPATLLPMIEQATLRDAHTLITADAEYCSNENVQALRDGGMPALVADNAMRQRDGRFAKQARHRQGEVLYDRRAPIESIKLHRPEPPPAHLRADVGRTRPGPSPRRCGSSTRR